MAEPAQPLEPNPDNETRRFVADIIAEGRRDAPLNINPAFESLGAVLVEGAPGEVAVAFTAGETTAQGNGVVSGGAFASMLDAALAIAVLSALPPGKTCATISLTVNMLRSAQLGDFVAMASVDKLGGKVGFAHASLYDADRILVANATSSLAILAMKNNRQ